jgi:hypothetical protein
MPNVFKAMAVVGSRSLVGLNGSKALAMWFMGNLLERFHYSIELVVSGGADGPDSWGEEFAEEEHIKLKLFLPDWKRYGRSAGFRRNADIVNAADIVLLFWDGQSRGTKHDLELCQAADKSYILYTWNGSHYDVEEHL